MQYGYHSSELISIALAAQSLGTSVRQVNSWIKDGRFPALVTVDGASLHSSPVVPLDELNYVAALMAAGKSWSYIEREVERLLILAEGEPLNCSPSIWLRKGIRYEYPPISRGPKYI